MSSTIAAIITAPITGPVGLIRLSGENAIKITAELTKNSNILSQASHTQKLYKLYKNEEHLDTALVSIMRAPNSYTGEDVVELSCHGSIQLLVRVLNTLISYSARQALPGEFTKRAFLNGKLDLAQAEAVADMISSEDKGAALAALQVLDGHLSRKIKKIYTEIIEILADILVALDFSEEGIELQVAPTVAKIKLVDDELYSLSKSFEKGKLIKNGIDTVIVGRPNTGKSTLMNFLSGFDKSIVTNIPGTTRDMITERVNIGSLTLNITDTAGIHDSRDMVESIGIEKTKKALQAADLVLAVFDSSEELTPEDLELCRLTKDKTTIALYNKQDLEQKLNTETLKKYFTHHISISAAIGTGLNILEETILKLFFNGELNIQNGNIITNVRHFECITRAKSHLEDAIKSINSAITLDAVCVDLESAADALGEIGGKTVSQEVIDNIFSRFCVGK